MNGKILSVKGLNKSFKQRKVLKDINFNIYENEIVGFIGENGAGKSTTMKCIVDLVIPDSGNIEILGYDVRKKREEALKYVSAVIENPGLYFELTGRENIKMIANLRDINKSRIDEIEDIINLGKDLDRKVSEYSMGMKQRLGLGISLLTEPKLLILDEPSNGLDPRGIMELRELLLRLVKETDISILFSSHQLSEVEELADRIIWIRDGELVEFTGEDIYTNSYILDIDNKDSINIINKIIDKDAIEYLIDGKIRISIKEEKELSNIIKELSRADIEIKDIDKISVDMESIYKQVYG